MKKILALMLTVMMLLTSVSLTVAAEEPLTPTQWYAGLNTVTLKFDVNVTAENAPAVEITTIDGTPISTTAAYKSNIMTLTFASKLALDTEYLITINGNKHIFKVTKVWEPTFSGNETDGYDVSGIKFCVYNNQIGYYYVTKDNEIVVGNKSGGNLVLIPAVDTNNEEYKNASLCFDVKYPNDWGYAASHAGFNLQSDADRFIISDLNIGYDTFFWLANADIYTPRRAYKIGSIYTATGDVNKGAVGFTKNTSNANASVLSTDVEYTLSGYYGDDYDVALTGSGETAGNAVYKAASATFGAKVSEMTPCSWTVDKMGATANLVINNTFVDTYIPQEYYTSSGATGTAPEYGYFAFGSVRQEKIFSNIMLTKTVARDYEAVERNID